MNLFTPRNLESKPMTLRPYQMDAVQAVYRHLREREDNPCVVIPTGGGKTPVIATICSDAVNLWNGRVLILAHVKELLEQARDKLDLVCPDIHVGIYSAGLNRRDSTHPVIIAGIQSVYQKADDLGRFDLVIVDEAHMIPPGESRSGDGEGMYRRFLEAARAVNPHLRVIGLTATPFRMSSGPICVPPPDGILNAICYEIGVRELIRDGYLSLLKSKAGRYKADFQSLHVRAGEFMADEVEALMDQDMLVQSACREIVDAVRIGGRRACLVFASGVEHGKHVTRTLEEFSQGECGFIDGQTPSLYRDELIRRFRDGGLKFLVNVNVLTTGFDAPNVDCVALLRPTMSPGLYYQMVGRGFRQCEGKTDCLVLDFGGNVLRHGPVDAIRITDIPGKGSGEAPAKECPQCQALIATGYAACPDCGYEFPPPERRRHEATAGENGILSGEVTITEYEVADVYYSVHAKRDAPPQTPRTMRVDYQVGYHQHQSEWVCFEHSGYARQKAQAWWRLRSTLPVPNNADDAVALANAGALALARSIKVRAVVGEKYDRIVDYELGAKPDSSDMGSPEPTEVSDDVLAYMPADDDIPF